MSETPDIYKIPIIGSLSDGPQELGDPMAEVRYELLERAAELYPERPVPELLADNLFDLETAHIKRAALKNTDPTEAEKATDDAISLEQLVMEGFKDMTRRPS